MILIGPNSLFCGVAYDTLVRVPTGFSRIDDLKLSNFVYGFEIDQKSIPRQILYKKKYLSAKCYCVVIEDEEIIVSEDQQFLLAQENLWIKVKDLKAGDILVNLNDGAIVDKVYVLKNTYELCDITVDKIHNFHVTQKNILVHNFAPVFVGIALVFGEGIIEFSGISLMTSILGVSLGIKLVKNSKKNESQAILELGGGSISFGPEGPDENENKKNSNIDKQSYEELKRSKASYEKLIKEHLEKLKNYINSPESYDNQNLLKNAASAEIRRKIIEGRIKSLESQILKQRNELEKITQLLMKLGSQ